MKNSAQIFKDRKISIVFESLPKREYWNSPLLDLGVKVLINNLVSFLSKKEVHIQVVNQTNSIVNTIAVKSWQRYQTDIAKFSQISKDELLSSDSLVVGLGFTRPTKETLQINQTKVIILRTGINELFPKSFTIIDELPEFAVGAILRQLEKSFV